MANLLERASVVLTPTAYNNGEALCIKPDDGSGDFDFSRNSAATRANAQGLDENVQILSSNLVQNGDFSNGSTGWNLVSANASIGENKLIANSVVTENIATQSGIVPISKPIILKFDLILNSGGFRVLAGSGGTATNITTSGTYTLYETSGTGGTLDRKSVG